MNHVEKKTDFSAENNHSQKTTPKPSYAKWETKGNQRKIRPVQINK